ncbi:MAG: MaoC family dehydratase N-terminal domain-containing protein [Firmicutes bacterium]|nr:hypothetical protein [Clostridiales bacterium]MBQ9930969.1 MaoC family dehydratase N-terminal domain-containing protein [Bacillota bacterium]
MYLNDLKIDMEFDIPEVVITKERMQSFAEVYDPFPMHLDEEYAAKSRYGQLIAPGVMTFMSVWANFMRMNILGEELIAGKSTKIEWFKAVYAGDTLKGTARISNITRRNAYNGIAEITIDIYNQHGEYVLKDVTESVMKYREE